MSSKSSSRPRNTELKIQIDILGQNLFEVMQALSKAGQAIVDLQTRVKRLEGPGGDYQETPAGIVVPK